MEAPRSSSEPKHHTSKVDDVALTPAIEEKAVSLTDDHDDGVEKPQPPWQWKLTAVILVTLIRFGGSWSGGITGSMKSTLKSELHINNAEYALLDATDTFIKSVLILGVGYVTDRFGGARTLFYGNALYSVGSVLVAAAAQVRSYRFMVGARVIMYVCPGLLLLGFLFLLWRAFPCPWGPLLEHSSEE
jgi:MFS family permease